MNVEQAIELIQSILSAQKLTIQEHNKVQEAFALILKTRKRPKADIKVIDNGNDAIHLSGVEEQGQ
jgi:hypothetical protein